MTIDVSLTDSFHTTTSPTPAGSFERLAAAQEWLSANLDSPGAAQYACQAIIGWLDVDVRDDRLKAAIWSEVKAIRAYIEG